MLQLNFPDEVPKGAVIQISNSQAAALLKLALYLIFYPRDLKHFDMSRFAEGTFYLEEQQTECGSVGCALGHGPHAGFPKEEGTTWGGEYSQHWFGLSCRDDSEQFWDWCFHGEWVEVDNTPQGAGQRILYLLRHGLPNNAQKQMWGEAELCYQEIQP